MLISIVIYLHTCGCICISVCYNTVCIYIYNMIIADLRAHDQRLAPIRWWRRNGQAFGRPFKGLEWRSLWRQQEVEASRVWITFLLPTSTDFGHFLCKRIWWRIRGKSTDLPQLLLAETQQSDAAAKILCAQPRRIGATTLASYVSQRTKTVLGGEDMGIQTGKTLSAFLWRVWRSPSVLRNCPDRWPGWLWDRWLQSKISTHTACLCGDRHRRFTFRLIFRHKSHQISRLTLWVRRIPHFFQICW